jgi:putative copper export protein/mono/diheme cytochrome c family protein
MLNGALPNFDLAEGGLLLALLRSLSVASLFSAYGTLVFRAVVAPKTYARMAPEEAGRIDRRLRRLVGASLAVQAVALLAWLVVEAGIIAGADSLAERVAALMPVLETTLFGHVVLLQLAGVAAVALMLRRDVRLSAGIGAVATVLQVGHSHAIAIDCDPLLLASDGVHLLSAGAWLGGLLPLLLVVQSASPKAGCTAARWFSPLGKLCLYGMVVTAAIQGWELLGGWAGLVASAYGWMVLVKAALFGVLFGFAWLNRYRFAPALLDEDGAAAKRMLVRSIALQTGFGLAVVAAAGILSNLPPGLHTQLVWPFSERPSLVTIQEDADFRREAIGAVLALGGAVLVLALGIAFRRLRWPAMALAAAIAWFAVPHLDLFFVEAYPTSFYRSPTRFSASAIVQGAGLYQTHCTSCHGAEGAGDGPAAKGLPVPPADLTADHLWGHSDGELFWWLSHGIDAPSGDGMAMPGFAGPLSEYQRWTLIDYIRAHNAGLAHAASGLWPVPVPAPDFPLSCDGQRIRFSTLRGKVLRIAFTDRALLPIPAQDGVEVVTILVPPAGVPPPASGCVTSDPAVPAAYAAVTGLAPNALTGQQVIADSNGWLRAAKPIGSADGPDGLLAEIDQICRHPIENGGDSGAHHHHS